jgi:predicted ABC-type ATPase
MNRPHLYIIAGPNGSGKTTFANKFLPQYAKCDEFINSDLIAKGFSPFNPEKAAIRSGRIVLSLIREIGRSKKNFGFETTLSGRTYVSYIESLKQQGYVVHLYFLRLSGPALACRRVIDRVKQGGHNVPPVDIRRRFKTGIKNFFTLYEPLADSWALFDNSGKKPVLIAQREPDLKIFDKKVWNNFKGKAALQ